MFTSNDAGLEEHLIAERRQQGLDTHDEVWDGDYVMAPLANSEHQQIVGRLQTILGLLIDLAGNGQVFPGLNISDQAIDWRRNYRCPDVLVYLNANRAENRDSHWMGGPDFAVEVVSPGDRSREKIDFYAGVGVRELLIIDRDPWQLELFRLSEGRLRSVAVATQANAVEIKSQVVPINVRLDSGAPRPSIGITSNDGQSWSI